MKMIGHIYYLNKVFMNNFLLELKKLRFIYFHKIIRKLKVDEIFLDIVIDIKYTLFNIISYKFF